MRRLGLLALLITMGAGCSRAPETAYVPIVPAGVRCSVPLRCPGDDRTAKVRINGAEPVELAVRGGISHVVAGPFPAGRVSVEVLAGASSTRHDVFALERGLPAIVCDVDHTIDAAGSVAALMSAAGEAGKPVDGSREALAELAESYSIIYLTARAEPLWAKTEAFLRREAFPDGPLLGWRMGQDPVSRATLKTRRLRELEAVWPTARWGIGDKASDEEAYRAAGLGSILLEPAAAEPVRQVADFCWRVRSWRDAVALIRQHDGAKQ